MYNLFSFRIKLICKIDIAYMQSFLYGLSNKYQFLMLLQWAFIYNFIHVLWKNVDELKNKVIMHENIFMSNCNGTFMILNWLSLNCMRKMKETDLRENHKETISVWSAVKWWCSMRFFFCNCGFYSFLETWLWMCTVSMSITFPWLWRKSKQLRSQNLAWTSS